MFKKSSVLPRLFIKPESPRSGESDSVEFGTDPPSSAISCEFEVTGSDGFHIAQNRVGGFIFTVPGAAKGVKDYIVTRGQFPTLRLEIVFGETAAGDRLEEFKKALGSSD